VVALLNDDSNEVGQVHLGVVHCWVLDAPHVTKREQMITQLSFMSPAELQEVRDSLETWSQLCLNGLDTMAARRAAHTETPPKDRIKTIRPARPTATQAETPAK
ncbi:MAG: hypothetical protein JW741_14920, partial [Sedimentisphaerales bacterium]|nr:hypothetical protein [Sedimentisphaerales bacterium]